MGQIAPGPQHTLVQDYSATPSPTVLPAIPQSHYGMANARSEAKQPKGKKRAPAAAAARPGAKAAAKAHTPGKSRSGKRQLGARRGRKDGRLTKGKGLELEQRIRDLTVAVESRDKIIEALKQEIAEKNDLLHHEEKERIFLVGTCETLESSLRVVNRALRVYDRTMTEASASSEARPPSPQALTE